MTQLLHAKRVEVIFASSPSVSLPFHPCPTHTHTHSHSDMYVVTVIRAECVYFNRPVCCVQNRCHYTDPGTEEAAAENETTESVRQWKIDHTGLALIIRYLDTLKNSFQAVRLGFVKQPRYHLKCLMIMNIDFSFNFKHFAFLLGKGRQHRCAGDPEVKESAVSYYNSK